jgi:8-oxo-dGTP pyrophosphatase MutT (NUDIX family)
METVVEPQKFFVGVVDLFAILMPGALLAYIAKAGTPITFGGLTALGGTEGWAVFLFASYLLGHMIFLIGSWLDFAYDGLRRCTDRGQLERLAEGKSRRNRFVRWLARVLFKKGPDAAVDRVLRFKERALETVFADGTVNAFQWCKARLTKELPEGLAAVQRFEADSKFFRSFVIVLPALALLDFQIHWWALVPILIAAELLALWRYVEQRFKATQQAYWYIVTIESTKEKVVTPGRRPRADGLTHAGGVVFTIENERTRYLLVEATKDRHELVLPKGHIEPGEDPAFTAVREVREETGVWARSIEWLDDKAFGAEAPLVRVYLMKAVAFPDEWPPEERQHGWYSYDAAIAKLNYKESRDLLEAAERRRTGAEPRRPGVVAPADATIAAAATKERAPR